MKRIIMGLLALGLLIGGESSHAWAKININSQGTAQAPVSVNTATLVIPAAANRINWTIYSETAALRCTVGTYSQASGGFTAPATTPTTTVGFYFPAGQLVSEKQLMLAAYMNGPNAVAEDEAKLEVDCASVSGVATNVDSWEELVR